MPHGDLTGPLTRCIKTVTKRNTRYLHVTYPFNSEAPFANLALAYAAVYTHNPNTTRKVGLIVRVSKEPLWMEIKANGNSFFFKEDHFQARGKEKKKINDIIKKIS